MYKRSKEKRESRSNNLKANKYLILIQTCAWSASSWCKRTNDALFYKKSPRKINSKICHDFTGFIMNNLAHARESSQVQNQSQRRIFHLTYEIWESALQPHRLRSTPPSKETEFWQGDYGRLLSSHKAQALKIKTKGLYDHYNKQLGRLSNGKHV